MKRNSNIGELDKLELLITSASLASNVAVGKSVMQFSSIGFFSSRNNLRS